jgi:hypothetical protein
MRNLEPRKEVQIFTEGEGYMFSRVVNIETEIINSQMRL